MKIWLAVLVIAFVAGAAMAAEKPMIKIYIHTDMEGITGIDTFEMIQRDGERFMECRKLLMEDINAAVEGAFEGGADYVMVLDSHGGGNNFLPNLLDKRAVVDTKPNKKWWGVTDDSFSGTFFIGAHPMAGTLNGFLDHTQSSMAWFNYSVNGRRFGELAQWAMVAGNWGVPMLMVSGDEAGCKEAREFFSPVETAVVKRGIGRNKAELVPTEEARKRIREAAKRAISLVGKAKPFVPEKPIHFEMVYYRSDFCDGPAKHPGRERVDARTLRWVSSDPLDLFP